MNKAAKHIKRIARYLPIAALFAFAFAVYAASSYQVNYTATVQVNEHGTCQEVTNNSGAGLPIFVPTNSSGEWSAFRGNLPGGVGLAPCYSYSWQSGGWSGCSVGCGIGTQTRSVWCQRNDGSTVADGFCGGGKPATSQACDAGPCYSYSWQTGGWGGCSVSCGTGTQYRSVWCQRNDGATVDNAYCGGGMPAGSQACDMGSCCAPNAGQGCVGETNNCGDAYNGTYMCNGLCSAQSAPPDVGDIWVCSGEYCVNSDYVCDWDGYNCSYECVDWDNNCGWESGC
jgi:hypothetical protein